MSMATTSSTLSKKEKLLEIVQNGRQFLIALEQFAATTDFSENDDHKMTTTSTAAARMNSILQGDSELSGRLLNEAERPITASDKFHDDYDKSAQRQSTRTTAPAPDITNVEEVNPAPTDGILVQTATTTTTTTPAVTETTTPTTTTTQPLQQQQTPPPPIRTGGIAQFCGKTGTVLGHFPSISLAAESLVETMPTGLTPKVASKAIGDVLHGQRRKLPMYKGFYFRYIGYATTPMPKFPILRNFKYRLSYSAAVASATTTTTTTTTNTAKGGEDVKGLRKRKREENSGRVAILQFCAKTGKQLGHFDSVVEAAKSLAALPSSSAKTSLQFRKEITRIKNNSDKQRPEFQGFYFRDANDVMAPFPLFPIPETQAEWVKVMHKTQTFTKRTRRNRPVLQFCAKTGRQIGRFNTQTHAATDLAKKVATATTTTTTTATAAAAKSLKTTVDTLRKGIGSALKGKTKNNVYAGSYFRYEDDDTDSPMPTFPIVTRYSPLTKMITTTTSQQLSRQEQEEKDNDTDNSQEEEETKEIVATV